MNDRRAITIQYKNITYSSRREFARAFSSDDKSFRRSLSRLKTGWPLSAISCGYLIKVCGECGSIYFTETASRNWCSGYCRDKNSHSKKEVIDRRKKWGLANKERLNNEALIRQRKRMDTLNGRDYLKRWKKESCKNLKDGYVKKLLIGKSDLKARDIPSSLVALKREQIKLNRKIKEVENEKC